MRILTLALLLITLRIDAQDYDWWVQKHNWDGHTHWTSYMTTTQKYMGPNALPVPEIHTGQLRNKTSLGLFAEAHLSKGDKTYNQFTNLFVPLSSRVGVEIHVVPFETFQLDTITRDERFGRVKSGKGSGGGDIYFSTQIQLLKETESRPGILGTVNLKTASGNNLQSARFTDSPGYFMDVSIGKNFTKTRFTHRPFALAGFYSYQTYDPEHAQNDAFTYGLGYAISTSKLELKGTYAGYIGYINDGDRPMIGRIQLKTTKSSGINYLVQVQRGILQYEYTSVRAGIVWILPITFN